MMKRRKKSTTWNMFDLDKTINKIIVVLFILLIVLIMKTINSRTTTTLVGKIEEGIYYDFNWKKDGEYIKSYITSIIGSSKERFKELNISIFDHIKK